MKTDWEVIIVGAGIAGLSAARTVADAGKGSGVLLVNSEDRLPYKRTKISKSIASGFTRDAFALETEQWYAENGIRLVNGVRVERLDIAAHSVLLDGNGSVTYGKLILATGSRPVIPAGSASTAGDGTSFFVRSANDVERLLAEIDNAPGITVVGGGVLGVEVAEQVRRRATGKPVILRSRSGHLLSRQLDRYAADHLRRVFVSRGVQVEFRADGDERSEAYNGIYIYAIGAVPDVRIASAAGLRVREGVVVDEYLRSSDGDVFAAGDLAEHPGGRISYLWHAAERQGAVAARNALGDSEKYGFPPFRLKCEVFDHYYFSAGDPPQLTGPDICTTVEQTGDRYRRCYWRATELVGVVMIDDGERAKLYQQAVFEGWSMDRLAEEIPWQR